MASFITSEYTDGRFCAVSGHNQAIGKTMGEALDGLASLMKGTDAGALVLIQKHTPDRFFTSAQHERLEDLRTRQHSLTEAERTEWEMLVNAELDATMISGSGLASTVRKAVL